MTTKRLDDDGANQFQGKLNEQIDHCRVTMALIANNEKTGKASVQPGSG